MNSWLLSFLVLACVLTASGVLLARNVIYAALCMIASMVWLTAVYLAVGAEFVGFANLLVYVGAISIIIIFSILLTSPRTELLKKPRNAVGLSIAVVLFAVMVHALTETPLHTQTASALTVKEIGLVLAGRYLVELLVMGVLMTAALIGAVWLALPKESSK